MKKPGARRAFSLLLSGQDAVSGCELAYLPGLDQSEQGHDCNGY